MVSWHKVGQKVACVRNKPWRPHIGAPIERTFPENGEVCTIARVLVLPLRIGFALEEYDPKDFFDARNFRPVYPQIIDELRRLEAPQDERVREVV